MEIQIVTPSPTTTPYTTAPSSPHRFPQLSSTAHPPVPSTHSWASNNRHRFRIQLHQKPTTPSISAAEELFHAGKVKPLKHVPDDPSRCNNQGQTLTILVSIQNLRHLIRR
ncbi:hypothetical protein Hanom_Chr17g01535261 [Helianthus anomalus]